MIAQQLLQRTLDHPSRQLRCLCDKRVEVQLAVSGRMKLAVPHKLAVSALDIDPAEERYLLSGGLDGLVCCYDLSRVACLAKPQGLQPLFSVKRHDFNASSVLWYPRDTGLFLSASYDCTVQLWDTNRAEPVHHVELDDKVYHIAMAPTGVSHVLVALASGSANVQLLDLRTATVTHHLFGHTVPIWTVAWSPSNQHFLISGSCDGSIRMWDVRRSGCLGALDPSQSASPEPPGAHHPRVHHRGHHAHSAAVTAVAFTRDGRYIISTSQDGTVRLWDTLDSAALVPVSFEPFQGSARFGCSQVSVSMSDRFLYVPSNRNVLVYSLKDGCTMAILEGHFDSVHTTTCHPSRRTVLSGGKDCAILAWDAASVVSGGSANVDRWSDDEG